MLSKISIYACFEIKIKENKPKIYSGNGRVAVKFDCYISRSLLIDRHLKVKVQGFPLSLQI